jgi:xylan 1,4-beta-xylosidase
VFVIEGVPIVVPLALAILWIGQLVLDRTRFGLHIYAVGGNPEGARRAGINVTRVRISAFIICSVLAVVAGLFTVSQVGVVQSSTGARRRAVRRGCCRDRRGQPLRWPRPLMQATVGAFLISMITNGLGLLGYSAGHHVHRHRRRAHARGHHRRPDPQAGRLDVAGAHVTAGRHRSGPEPSSVIHNPVIPGFHPDPSVVRAGDDYFLATSTFVWEPGSGCSTRADLQHWDLVGHALPAGTHDFRGLAAHEGIWAPDLSHDAAADTFYLTYSVMRSTAARYFDADNFVVTASSRRRALERPVYLNSVGFDPSFLHDDDGRHWLVTLEWDPSTGYEHPGAIVLDEYDPQQRRLVGESRRIYRGGSNRGCLESPHLYRHDGQYYLMAAEGGTGYAHGVTLARSPVVEGPYEPDPLNPFLTSNPADIPGRGDPDHLKIDRFNPDVALQKAGHGCLVSTPNGEWYVAHLCARPIGSDHRCTLGRETAVQQVRWSDDGWLRLSTGGTVAGLETPSPSGVAPGPAPAEVVLCTEFTGPGLDIRFSTFRRPATDDWLTVAGDGPGLRLRGGEAVTSRQESSVVATPLQGFVASVATRVDVGTAPLLGSRRAAGHLRRAATSCTPGGCTPSREHLGDPRLRSSGLSVKNGRSRTEAAGTTRGQPVLRPGRSYSSVGRRRRGGGGALVGGRRRTFSRAGALGLTLEPPSCRTRDRRLRRHHVGLACVDGYRARLCARFDYFERGATWRAARCTPRPVRSGGSVKRNGLGANVLRQLAAKDASNLVRKRCVSWPTAASRFWTSAGVRYAASS